MFHAEKFMYSRHADLLLILLLFGILLIRHVSPSEPNASAVPNVGIIAAC